VLKTTSLLLVVFVLGCGCASNPTVIVERDEPIDHQVEMIAIDPESGAWGDALAKAVTRVCGCRTRSRESIARLTDSLGIVRRHLLRPENMRAIAGNGIDAYLFASSCHTDSNGRPRQASATLRDTHSARPFLTVYWYPRGRRPYGDRCRGDRINAASDYEAAAHDVAIEICERLVRMNRSLAPPN
jgi:hypothetical protein